MSVIPLITGCLSRQGNNSRIEGTRTTNMSKRGQAPEVTVKKEIQKDDIEYREENNSVRYRSGSKKISPDDQNKTSRKPVYNVIPFSQWSKAQCADLTASKINETLNKRIESGLSGVAVGVKHSSEGKKVYVDYSTTRNREGEVIEKPDVTFGRIVEVTPKEVTATVEISGKTHTEKYAIFVKKSSKRQQ